MKRSKRKPESSLAKQSRRSKPEGQTSTSWAELHETIFEFDRGTPDTSAELVRDCLNEEERTCS
jgi:hypothetical protein